MESGESAKTDFFQPPDRRIPTREYLEVIEARLPLRWRIYPSHFWTQVSGPRPLNKIQGWKIHISATPSSAKTILEKVASICWDEQSEFKFASDSYVHNLLISKIIGRQSGGKFITIYPIDDNVFDRLLERLYDCLKQHEGPYILSDRQYKDSKTVFYRYGGFRALEELNVFGEKKSCILDGSFCYIEDQRLARFHLPDFVKDRHTSPAAAPAADSGTKTKTTRSKPLFGSFFEIQRFIKYSNAGGVYLGRDIRDNSSVIVKEARPHCEYGQDGLNAMTQLRSEFDLLQYISSLEVAPRALAIFQEWQHLFLVQEQISGISLQSFLAKNSKMIWPDTDAQEMREWFKRISGIGVSIIEIINALHQKNVIYGDLSANNVIIEETSSRVRLIDFESSFIEGQSKAPNIHTTGYIRPGREQRNFAEKLDDQYALGCLLLYMVSPGFLTMALMPGYADMALEMLMKDYNLSPNYVQCVRMLLDLRPVNLPDAAQLLREANFDDSKKLNATAPQDFIDSIPRLRDESIKYIHAHTDFASSWQLFPIDAEQVFQLSFDYGVLGTIFALNRIQGHISGELRDWVLRSCSKATPLPGLLNGASGAAWLLSDLDCHEEAILQLNSARFHEVLYSNASLGYGYAGVGMALLKAWMGSGKQALLEQALQLSDTLCETAVAAETGCYWDSDEEGGVQLGLHKGPSGTALFLLHAYAATRDVRYLETAKAGVAFDMSQAEPWGLPAAYHPSKPETIISPYLHNGTAGLAMVVLRLYAITQDPSYLSFLTQAQMASAQKYTISGGLGRGLAGLGHFLLDLVDWLDDAQAYEQALRLAHGLTLYMVRRPEGLTAPASMGTTVSVSYMSGSAGMALFLHRLAEGGGAFHFVLDTLLRGYKPDQTLGQATDSTTGSNELLAHHT